MVEELKVIAEIFSNASDAALFAYGLYLGHSLGKVALIVFPIAGTIKFVVNRAFKNEA